MNPKAYQQMILKAQDGPGKEKYLKLFSEYDSEIIGCIGCTQPENHKQLIFAEYSPLIAPPEHWTFVFMSLGQAWHGEAQELFWLQKAVEVMKVRPDAPMVVGTSFVWDEKDSHPGHKLRWNDKGGNPGLRAFKNQPLPKLKKDVENPLVSKLKKLKSSKEKEG